MFQSSLNQKYTLNPNKLIVPNGLVGYWPLTIDTINLTNSIVYDISGNKLTGTINGTVSISSGQNMSCLNFNGSSNYISFVNNPVFPNVSRSQTVWFKSNGGDGCIIGNDDTSPPTSSSSFDIDIYIGTDNNIHMGAYTALGAITTSKNVNDNKWHFACLTYNTVSQYQYGYLDGQLIGSYSGNADIETYWFIGAGYSTSGWSNASNAYPWYFSGQIEEVRFYNRDLSPHEIFLLYKAGLLNYRTKINNF
jgi:hypothetical protein